MKNRGWLLAGIVSIVIFVLLIYQVRTVVVPLFIALVLAYLLDPAADYLETKGLSRSLSVVAVFGFFVVVAGSVLIVLVPALMDEVAQIKTSLPEYASVVSRLIPEEILLWLGVPVDGGIESLMRQSLEMAQDISADVIGDVLLFASRAFSGTISFLVALLGYCIIPVYLFYLLKDFDLLRTKLCALFPPKLERPIFGIALDVDQVVSAFVRGQLTVCAILALLYSVGLLVIGVDLALLIGISSGAAFIVPYLGTIIGIVAGASMAFVEFQDIAHPLAVVVWFVVVQGIEGTIISPKIVGDRVGLHPLATILAVFVCGELFGFWGLLIGVPLFATLSVFLRHLLDWYKITILEPLKVSE